MGLVVGERSLSEQDIRTARQLLVSYDVTLWALVSESGATQEAAAQLGLDIQLPLRSARPAPPEPAPVIQPPAPEPVLDTAETAAVVRRTMRSGVSVRHPGSVLVIGDVHSGAEIIAGGDIVVWGKLHGTVHAGASGDDRAVVCALDLAPTQLRIGHYITRSPDDRRRKVQPEMARVINGRIEAVAWNPKG